MVFIESHEFSRAISQFSDLDYAGFQRDLAANPDSGDVMQGCGGFRKVRMAFPSVGIGKSGGARVIYLHIPEKSQIYLTYMYGKSSKSTLTKAECNALRQISGQIRSAAGA